MDVIEGASANNTAKNVLPEPTPQPLSTTLPSKVIEQMLIVDIKLGTQVGLSQIDGVNFLVIERPEMPRISVALTAEQVEALGTFTNQSKIKQEIERKWLIVDDSFLNLQPLKTEKISQGYIAISSDGSELRVRSKGNEFILTMKSEGALIRGESEVLITSEQCSAIWPATEGSRVEKTRYIFSAQQFNPSYPANLKFEIDIFEKPKLEVAKAIAECEFPNATQAEEFIPPAYFGADVTSDKRFKNKSIARVGFPKQ